MPAAFMMPWALLFTFSSASEALLQSFIFCIRGPGALPVGFEHPALSNLVDCHDSSKAASDKLDGAGLPVVQGAGAQCPRAGPVPCPEEGTLQLGPANWASCGSGLGEWEMVTQAGPAASPKLLS